MLSLLIFLTIIIKVLTGPIIIRSGISNHKDEGNSQNVNVFDLNTIKGLANYEGEAGFNRDKENKVVQAQDIGNYNEEKGEKKIHTNENNFAGDKFHQESGGEIADSNKKSASKKGHHKSGYTKTFHKDESASTSSYYDDADSENHDYAQNSKKNLYGDAGQQSQRGAHLDDRKHIQDEGKKGYYNNAGNYEKDMGNERDYHSKKYYDNQENLGHRNAEKQYDEGGRYGEEKYISRKPHYLVDPYYEPEPYHHRPFIAPKKTITIYEDPRYDGYEKYPPYDDDYIQLELKRPSRDYDYDHRPYSYDYYY